MIECKKYTLTELKKILNITKWQWEERKEDLLKHLELYFDYEVTQVGRGYCFEIFEQYAEYEPMNRKNNASEASEHYKIKTEEQIEKQPWNTGSNIARNIKANNDEINEHSEGTIVNYVRPIIKKNYIFEKSQWMRLSDNKLEYVPLTEKEMVFLQSLFDKNNITKQQMEIMGQYKANVITLQEAKDKFFDISLVCYGTIMEKFKDEFGFVPQNIPHLVKCHKWDNK